MRRLVLMTQPELADPIVGALTRAAPSCRIVCAWSLPELEDALAERRPFRLLSVGSPVILPRDLLQRLPAPAYNLHPGPPNYPGIFPSVFALYEGAREFGVTLHEMAPVVDTGAIVATQRFAIAPQWDRLALDAETFRVMLGVLERFASRLGDVDTPLTYSGEVWSGRRRTRNDFQALCLLPPGFTNDDFARRLRAVGEGPEHSLQTSSNGLMVRLDTGRRGVVVRAGQPVPAAG